MAWHHKNLADSALSFRGKELHAGADGKLSYSGEDKADLEAAFPAYPQHFEWRREELAVPEPAAPAGQEQAPEQEPAAHAADE